MRNIELRHTFPHLLSDRCLKTLVAGRRSGVTGYACTGGRTASG